MFIDILVKSIGLIILITLIAQLLSIAIEKFKAKRNGDQV